MSGEGILPNDPNPVLMGWDLAIRPDRQVEVLMPGCVIVKRAAWDRAKAILGLTFDPSGRLIESLPVVEGFEAVPLCPHGERLSDGCADCDREHREATR